MYLCIPRSLRNLVIVTQSSPNFYPVIPFSLFMRGYPVSAQPVAGSLPSPGNVLRIFHVV